MGAEQMDFIQTGDVNADLMKMCVDFINNQKKYTVVASEVGQTYTVFGDSNLVTHCVALAIRKSRGSRVFADVAFISEVADGTCMVNWITEDDQPYPVCVLSKQFIAALSKPKTAKARVWRESVSER